VGRLVLLTDVRLELDDPGNPRAGAVVADQQAAEQGATDLQRRQREDVADAAPDYPLTRT
jgi:hypothetical protein